MESCISQHQHSPVIEQPRQILGRVTQFQGVFGNDLLLTGSLGLIRPFGELLVQQFALLLLPLSLLRLRFLLNTGLERLALLNGLLELHCALLEGCVLRHPFGGVSTSQLGKSLLVTDKLAMQAFEKHVQVVGALYALRRDLFCQGLRLAFGFGYLCGLASVICILHVPGFQLRLLELQVAKVNLGVIVFGRVFFGGFSLLLFGLPRFWLGFFLALHRLFSLFTGQQRRKRDIVAGFASFFGEFRVSG